MRIVFVNLHSSWMLVKSAGVMVYKYSPAIKHAFILQYLLKHPEIEVCNYMNDRSFSLFTGGSSTLQKFLNLFSGIENDIVLKKNDIDPKRITVIKKPSDIYPDDIVIMYNVFGSDHLRGMQAVKGFKALSMIHFHGRENEDELIKQTGIDCYFNEINLEKSSEIFRKYYHTKRPWVLIPFVFAERFQNKKPFAERKNKAFSVGTITYKLHKEYIEIYKDSCLQPIRKLVKDNPEYYKDTIDCYSEDYFEGDEGKKVKESDNKLVAICKKIYNRFHTGRQTKYFSFDMVEKFNDYKMCIVGEERIGLPGIGFVEGMACGAAYLGIDSPMYRDYGLIPGVHYIAYDGTKEGLRKTIEYYQLPEHQEELERIANTGCEFVRKNFRGELVAEKLIKELVYLRDKKLFKFNNDF